ncbi:hypothetical protein GPECTOR_8g383 [Gonium pectorale]|uniref:Phospholipid/glycerol acyltransferase domain-containing protein n=1 Tax=Gonium pectorale TaxID=33097 RepID=A0A150GT41_GONPE|nr:hypothetical protein GPECTOR_8g383 [Gonium pectorale]|eukprot:KXZ53015.1 hypothetical protein GPECTOR_8g383 [Gonium pectorale]
MYMLGFRVKVSGREHIKKAEELGAIAVFNHSSYVDALIMMYMLAPSGVTKASLSNLPVIKYIIKAYQVIFLREERPDTSVHNGSVSGSSSVQNGTSSDFTSDSKNGKLQLNGSGSLSSSSSGSHKARKPNPHAYIVTGSATEVLKARVSDPTYGKPGGYPLIAIAPEGTCGDGRGLLEYRTGAFVPGVPVLPLCIKYGIGSHNPAWGQVYSVGWHFVRLMCQWRNEVEVTVLPPYVPSPEERADPRLFAANVRSLMGAAAGLPPQPHSYAHFLALKKLKVVVDWSGTAVLAPPGVVEADGTIDFAKHGMLM